MACSAWSRPWSSTRDRGLRDRRLHQRPTCPVVVGRPRRRDRWRGDRGPRRGPRRDAPGRNRPDRLAPRRDRGPVRHRLVRPARQQRRGVATRGARRPSRRRHAPRRRRVRCRPDRRRTARPRQRVRSREHEHRTGAPRHVPGRDRPDVRTADRVARRQPRSLERIRRIGITDGDSTGLDAASPVDQRDATWCRDHRVQVELGQLGHRGRERSDPQQQILEGVHVDRRDSLGSR